MSSRNSASKVEGGDSCHSRRVLETAIKGLNLKSNFYNSTRCIHNDRQGVLRKSWKNKVVTKSADNITRISNEPMLSSRSERVAPISDRSCYSIQTFNTFAVIEDQADLIGNTSNDLSICDLYIEEDKKYKNLTPFEIKLQKELEAYQVAKREAFDKWLKKKEEERKARNKKNNKPVIEVKISAEEREETFRKWCERKKQLEKDEKQRKMMEQQRMEEEKRKALEGKEEKLKEWFRKKAQIQREIKRKQKEEQLKLARLKEMRKKDSEEAYRQWLRQARHKPLPVPLNKGELSMKGSLTKMYVNPEPWKHSSDGSSSASNISD